MEKSQSSTRRSELSLFVPSADSSLIRRRFHYSLLLFATWTSLAFWMSRNSSSPEVMSRSRRVPYLTPKEVERIFLCVSDQITTWRLIVLFSRTVPNNISAHATLVQFATKPHLAGGHQDLVTAKDYLEILQTHLHITPPDVAPIFESGSHESQIAIRSLTDPSRWRHPCTRFAPTAWIDTYYPLLNTPLDRHLEVLDTSGNVVWKADLEEVGDAADPSSEYAQAVPAWHGLSRGGEATGRLAYVGRGRKREFDALVAQGLCLPYPI